MKQSPSQEANNPSSLKEIYNDTGTLESITLFAAVHYFISYA